MGKYLSIVLLCLLFVCGSAYGYTASGKVYDVTMPGIKAPVPNPSGTISYPATGGTVTNPITGSPDASYTGGWPSTSLIGKSITVRAQNQSATAWGSKTWTAQTNTEPGKDVLIRSAAAINPGLGLDLDTLVFANPGVQSPTSAVMYNYTDDYVPVDSFSAVVAYDNSKVFVIDVFPPDSFFDIEYFIDIPEPGMVTVNGTSTTPIGLPPHTEESLELFKVAWEVLPFESRDLTVVTLDVTLPDLAIPNRAISHQTEYLLGPMEHSDPYFLLDTDDEWQEARDQEIVRPVTQEELEGYIMQWQDVELEFEGEPYPPTNWFAPDELYVYEGSEETGDPNDGGLVMVWGETQGDGNFGSAFKYDYKKDPDYSNCTITVQVLAPQTSPAPPNVQINQVSLGLQNIPMVGGPVRAWYWNVGGPTDPIQWNIPTTITIDTSKTGLAATNPPANGYVNNPGFNIKTVQYIIVDENGTWMGAPQNAVPPGGTIPGMWNYWHNLSVTPNIGGGGGSGAVDSKWFVKYSQPPELLDPAANPPLINGWDELSDYNNPPLMADDWPCKDKRPITDIHWWGSFIGWTQPTPPPNMPQQFHIGIWTDVPAGIDRPYSHPGQLVWENFCDNFVWNFAGYDVDPFGRPDRENEACFQFAQFLSQDEWFYQEPSEDGTNIYWLSIAPIYDAANYPPQFPWGWKTRPHIFQDDACSIIPLPPPTGTGIWPPALHYFWEDGHELLGPDGVESWDLAFELTTNEPAYVDDPIPGDISGPTFGTPDGSVDIFDVAFIAAHWLTVAPITP